MLTVTLPDKSPGVIPLDSRTRLDEIYNSQKAFNDIKEVLPERLLLFAGALPESRIQNINTTHIHTSMF